MNPRTAAIIILFLATGAHAGPYLDQPPPGDEARLFAPGIVSDGLANRDLAITPDGREIYWSSNLREFGVSVILFVRQGKAGWSAPEVAPFSRTPGRSFFEPALSPDGAQLFYVAAEPGGEASDIWVVDRLGEGWGEPRKLGPPVNTPGKEYFPSLTRDGTLYFTKEGNAPGQEAIYRARRVDGGYGEPERLPAQVNSGRSQFNAFVDPDERYLIVPVWGREDSLGSVDYYVVFRSPDDRWSEPVNLGPQVNTAGGREYTPYVSPDGRYFFFMATRAPAEPGYPPGGITAEWLQAAHGRPENGLSDLYWIDAAFIGALRPADF